jgi:hypothetical protein
MKIGILFTLLALPAILTSCATPPPPQAFHGTDQTALIIESLDGRTCQMLRPAASDREENDRLLTAARRLPQHETAVVILENYNEALIGEQFRDRGTSWFVGLRTLGYRHIVFLQGKGVADPEGLLTLAEYD